jgi:hypothetical protein
MDIIAARHAVQYARKWVTEGNGPLLMEFVTYRYGGHSCVLPHMQANFITHRFYLFIYAGCPIPEPPIVPERKFRGCEVLRTLSEVCSAISKSGVLPAKKNSRYVILPFHPLRIFEVIDVCTYLR